MVLSAYARSLDTQHAAMNEKFDEFFYGDVDYPASANESINNELLLRMMTEQHKKPEFLEVVLKAMSAQGSDHAEGAG